METDSNSGDRDSYNGDCKSNSGDRDSDIGDWQ